MAEPFPFDPRWVTRLGGLSFRPRGPSEGPLAGRHESPRRGRAGEFIDRRAYSPGDDRRRIDWKVYARSDRWTVREERDDTHLRVVFLLDVSASMGFASNQFPQKRHFAARLMAAAGYVLQQNRESMGWGFFERTLLSFQAPRAGGDALARLFNQLRQLPSGTIARFQDSFRATLSQSRGRGAVFVVSDFLGPLDDIFAGFRMLRTTGGDVSAFQVLDPMELDLSFRGIRRFVDLESGDSLLADPETLADSYHKKMEDRQKVLTRGLSALSVHHRLFRTDQPVDEGLAAYLGGRAARR